MGLKERALDWGRSHQPVVALAVTAVVTGLAISRVEPNYTSLQIAPDADRLRALLTHPGHATVAVLIDFVFAFAYGRLGLLLLRWARTRATDRGPVLSMVGVVVVAAAAFDELENVQLLDNIVRRASTTDAWIDGMGLAGTIKWACVMVAGVALVVVLVVPLVVPWAAWAVDRLPWAHRAS
ncbi:MAG: hypothetical protein QOG30_706 [Acidimicrobiaceae bacterium]